MFGKNKKLFIFAAMKIVTTYTYKSEASEVSFVKGRFV